MELTNKQIAFYKGYILPSVLEHYKNIDCLEKFKSIEGIDTHFKSFIEKSSLKKMTHEEFEEMIFFIYEFCEQNKIKDKNGEAIKCHADYDDDDYFNIEY